MENLNKFVEEKEIKESEVLEALKAIVYSLIGIFIFFIPIKVNGQATTFLYHISYKIQSDMTSLLKLFVVVFVLLGCIKRIIDKEENKIISISRFISIIIIVNIFYGNKSILMLSDNTIFLMEELILNTATLLPIASIFMTFLLDYGLLDIVESYSHKFMKNTYKMSGKTLVNIFIYLFTDCFCGYFITNNMYKKGKLRENEAVMLIANFSIASIWTFNYICAELDIDKFELIIVCLPILCIVNFITCRIYPFNKKKKSYYIKTKYKETLHKKDKFQKGMDKYLKNNNKKSIFKDIINNLEECFQIIINLIPNIILILFLGDIMFRSGIIIELFSYIFNPLLSNLRLIELDQIINFISMILYNNIVAIDSVLTSISYTTKLIIGIVTLISCVSISTNIIYIENTEINISIKELLLIFFQRIGLILGIYCLISYILIGYNM